MRLFSSRRRSLALCFVTAALCFICSGAIYSQSRAEPRSELIQIAPGLSMLAVNTITPNGPLKFWLVKADAKYRLGLEVADSTNIVKKRSVRNLAAQSNALVAVNGGFFAYGGAAVGAVKVGGEWQRLPWRNRTALGWNDKAALIAPLKGRLPIEVRRGNQTLRATDAAFNGFNLPGERVAIKDGFSLLTENFKPVYTVQPGETAATIQNRKIVAFYGAGANVALNAQNALLVARGAQAALLVPGVAAPDNLLYGISVAPSNWTNYSNILGAGPRLLAQGKVATNEVEEEFQPDVIARGPRTAVGWDKNRNWLLLVADGRQAASVGLTLPETAVLFAQLGAIEAMNLDGGSSTQLIVNGELMNTPSGLDPVYPDRPREVQVTNALTLKAK